MKKISLKTLFLLIFLPTFAAQADGPAVWTISDDDTTIHITGTVHIIKPDLVWMREDTKLLIQNATALILELDENQQSPAVVQPLVIKYGMLPAGQKLSEIIGAEKFNAILAAMGGAVPAQSIEPMRPWLAATTMTVVKMMQNGYDPESGADKSYITVAKEAGVPIQGLETADLQMAVLASLDGDDATDFIAMTLAQESEAISIIDEMTKAWTTQDHDKLAALLNDGFKEYPEMADKLLNSRNRSWAIQMETLLERPGSFVIAVGAGHLVGEGSLIDILTKSGYTVTQH